MLELIHIVEFAEGTGTNRYAVECPKHGVVVEFNYDPAGGLRDRYPRVYIEVAAQSALAEKCPGCMRQVKLPLAPKEWTGWTEDSEL